MSLRIAFDLDGTLADLDTALGRLADELFPPPPANSVEPAADAIGTGSERAAHAGGRGAADNGEALSAEEEQLEPPKVRALSRRQQHAIWETVRRTANFWESLDELEPGMVARIAEIAADRCWEVIFITQRPASAGDTTQRQTQRWLVAHGFDLPSVFVLGPGASRGRVASALSLDAVVDDRAENCLDVKVDSQARSFLISRSPAPNVAGNAKRLGIEMVQSIDELLDALAATPSGKPGLMGRLKKMIGV
jgi:hypothetical protein